MRDRPWYQHYDPGVPREATFADLSIPQFLERTAEAYPDATAVAFQNARLTYRELADQVDRLATALAALIGGRLVGYSVGRLLTTPEVVLRLRLEGTRAPEVAGSR